MIFILSTFFEADYIWSILSGPSGSSGDEQKSPNLNDLGSFGDLLSLPFFPDYCW